MTKKRVHIWITGRVQGVYYRQNTLKIATENNVKGWIKNLMDGRVEAVFEGNIQDVDKVVQWCSKGPTSANVTHLELMEEEFKDEFKTFKVKHF